MPSIKQPNLAFEFKVSNRETYIKYAVLLTFGTIMIVSPISYLKHKANLLTTTVSELQTKYDSTIEALSKNPVDITGLSSEVDGLNAEYNRLTEENYHLSTTLFDQIEKQLPKNTWITEYSFNRSTFYLKGNSTDVVGIETFFNNLNTVQKNLKLKVSHGSDNYEFEISTAQETK